MKKIALIDYGMGNLRNVERAFEAVGGFIVRVTDGAELDGYDAVVLPGVGNFGDGMAHLNVRNFIAPIKAFIVSGRPFFGICLGMQMLFERSEEAPGVPGLSILKGAVVRFPEHSGEKVPHMGWNTVTRTNQVSLQVPFAEDSSFYFVHTYYVKPEDAGVTAAVCEYILPFTAAVGCGNLYATQFHPEKSQDAGLALLRHFVKIVNERSS